jgi:hypothetical protein
MRRRMALFPHLLGDLALCLIGSLKGLWVGMGVRQLLDLELGCVWGHIHILPDAFQQIYAPRSLTSNLLEGST